MRYRAGQLAVMLCLCLEGESELSSRYQYGIERMRQDLS